MAATEDGPPRLSGRDQLRFTTDFPILQSYLDPNKVRAPPPAHLAASLGNLEQLNRAIAQLLKVAIDNGQQDRVQILLDFQAQLDRIPEQVFATLGREVPLSEIELQVPAAQVEALQQTHSEDELTSSGDTSESHLDDVSELSEDEETCPVCFDEYPASEMRSLLGCGEHKYCLECMNRHLSVLINDSELKALKCPWPNCTVEPAEYEIENLVSPETYSRYLQFAAMASLKTEAGTKWCVNKECGEAIVWDASEKKVVCPACKTEFCYDCGKAPHPGRECGAEPAAAGDPDASVQAWLSSKGAKVKPCPQCKEGIEKNDGCNHITCRNCRHQWCWLCSGDYLQPPNHFGQGLCRGFQFAPYDTLDEALAAESSSREDREREAAEARAAQEAAEAFARTPEGIRQRERARKRAAKARRRRKAKKVAKYTALAPLVVVGGVALVGVAVVASPFLIVGSLFS